MKSAQSLAEFLPLHEPEDNILQFPNLRTDQWPEKWSYCHVCWRCQRLREAVVGYWHNRRLERIMASGREYILDGIHIFVCEGCVKTYTPHKLEEYFLKELPEIVDSFTVRREAWQQWQPRIGWPQLYCKLMVQAVIDGFIEATTLDVINTHRRQFLEVLDDLHIWIVSDEISNWLRLYQTSSWHTKEQWLSSGVSAIRQRESIKIDVVVMLETLPLPQPSLNAIEKAPPQTPISVLDLPEFVLKSFLRYKIDTIERLCRFSIEELTHMITGWKQEEVMEQVAKKLAGMGWYLPSLAQTIWHSHLDGRAIASDREAIARKVLGNIDYNLFKTIRLSNSEQERIIARNKLLARHDRLAMKWANMNAGWIHAEDWMWDYDDLLQEARFGLVDAIKRFDVESGFRFTTYAVQWINNRLRQTIFRRKNLPAHVITAVKKLSNTIDRFRVEKGRYPGINELMAILKWPEEKIEEYLLYGDMLHQGTWASLDETLKEDGEATWGDIVAGSDNIEQEVIQRKLGDSLLQAVSQSSLLMCDQSILRKYWGIDGQTYTKHELAEELGITVSNVEKRIECALGELRSERVWQQVCWYFPQFATTPFEHILPKAVRFNQSVAAQLDAIELTEREKEIIKYRLGLWGEKKRTLEEIADMFGITRERVRQLEQKALIALQLQNQAKNLIVACTARRKSPQKTEMVTLFTKLGVRCHWPWDESQPVLTRIANWYKLSVEQLLARSQDPIHHDARLDVAAILFGRGWNNGQINLLLGNSINGHNCPGSIFNKQLNQYIEELKSSAKKRRLFIALVHEINRAYQHQKERGEHGTHD